MSKMIHRISRSHIVSFLLSLTIGLLALTLTACGGSSRKAATPVAPVAPAVVVSVTPSTVSLSGGATQTFKATVTGTTNTAVIWSVSEAVGGAIDSGAKYTAPTNAGTYHVVATSAADASASSAAKVTVTATVPAIGPAPVFTSTPTAAALEGAVYSYALTTDLAATFALSGSPVGATINGGTVSWTPTSDEARVSNSFQVTATTAAGGSQTQSWTVTPNGTITISSIDTYWSNITSTNSPNDLSGHAFSALVLDPTTGTYTVILPGTISSDGTSCSISGVPAGNYWLIHTEPLSGQTSNYWTNSSTFDLGTDYAGRKMPALDVLRTIPLALTSLTGLDSVDAQTWLAVTIPNQLGTVLYSNSIAANSEAYTGSSLIDYPIDAASGDEIYVYQLETPTPSASNCASNCTVSRVPGPAVNAGSATDITANLTRANPQSVVDFNFLSTLWTKAFNGTPPNGIYATIAVQPFVSDRRVNLHGSLPVLLTASSDVAESSDIDAGTVAYNNPYPPDWKQIYSAYASLPTIYGDMQNSYYTTAAPTSGFAPLISAVQNPMMNGADFFTTPPSATDSVTLSWTAPTGLTVAGYEVSYNCADPCPDTGGRGILYTASTSITLPPGFLAAGFSYGFEIVALADSRADYNSSPNRSGYPIALASVSSAPLSISSNTQPPIFTDQAIKARGASPNVIHSTYGSFLVTATGNKPLDAKARVLAPMYQLSLAQASKAGPVVK